VSGNHVYWSDFGPGGSGSTIGRARLNGTRADRHFITGADTPTGIAIAVTG
jgi:hypothetical protein